MTASCRERPAVGEGASLLVDTLFDLRLTAEMLDAMADITVDNPIDTVVNTHANGDHCYGNQLLAGGSVEFVASAAAAAEMDEMPPSVLARATARADDGPVGRFMRHAFGPFELAGIDVPTVTRDFTEQLDVDVAGGDLIEQLDPAVVVPGHGPLTDTAGAREVGDYLRFVRAEVVRRHAAGMTPEDAARDLDLAINGTRFGAWTDRERLVVTVHGVWRELDPELPALGGMRLLEAMAEDFARRSPRMGGH